MTIAWATISRIITSFIRSVHALNTFTTRRRSPCVRIWIHRCSNYSFRRGSVDNFKLIISNCNLCQVCPEIRHFVLFANTNTFHVSINLTLGIVLQNWGRKGRNWLQRLFLRHGNSFRLNTLFWRLHSHQEFIRHFWLGRQSAWILWFCILKHLGAWACWDLRNFVNFYLRQATKANRWVLARVGGAYTLHALRITSEEKVLAIPIVSSVTAVLTLVGLRRFLFNHGGCVPSRDWIDALKTRWLVTASFSSLHFFKTDSVYDKNYTAQIQNKN